MLNIVDKSTQRSVHHTPSITPCFFPTTPFLALWNQSIEKCKRFTDLTDINFNFIATTSLSFTRFKRLCLIQRCKLDYSEECDITFRFYLTTDSTPTSTYRHHNPSTPPRSQQTEGVCSGHANYQDLLNHIGSHSQLIASIALIGLIKATYSPVASSTYIICVYDLLEYVQSIGTLHIYTSRFCYQR